MNPYRKRNNQFLHRSTRTARVSRRRLHWSSRWNGSTTSSSNFLTASGVSWRSNLPLHGERRIDAMWHLSVQQGRRDDWLGGAETCHAILQLDANHAAAQARLTEARQHLSEALSVSMPEVGLTADHE